MTYLLSAIVLLGVLIAIHEFGHFIVGRMCKIHIYRFSIGMGPVIYKKIDKHGTEFALSALPLGGYVAFHTEKAADEELDLIESLTPEQKTIAAIISKHQKIGIDELSLDRKSVV